MMRYLYRDFILSTAFITAGTCFAGSLGEQGPKDPSIAFQADGVELLQNGDFRQSAYFWKKTDYYDSYLNGRRFAETSLEVVDESAKIRVRRRGNEHWHAHLLQTGIYLEKGKDYELSFRAKVEDKDRPEAPISLVASLIKDGSGVQVFFEDTVQVTENGAWQYFKLKFKSPGTDDFIRLDLNYGRKAGTVGESETFTLYLDDVSVRKTSDSNDPRVVPSDIGPRRPVSSYGHLEVNGDGQLSSRLTGKAVQLRGVSLHGIQWDRPWYYGNREALIEMKEKWKADLVRVPIYLGQGGYIEDKSILYSLAQIVDTAISLDMYVLIDWHVHNDAGDPNTYKSQALNFFDQMAKRYGDRPNVLFEIANEPNGVSWPDIKRYAQDVVQTIRAQSPNIIIVGTPVWSQEVQTAADDPIASPNIMYTLHFYAASHPLQNFKSKIETALSKKIGLFVTEFGTTGFGGDGTPNFDESKKWLDYLDRKGISWSYWTMSAENEQSAALRPGTHPIPSYGRGWSDSDLSDSGRFLKKRLTETGGFDPSLPPVDDSPIKVPEGDLALKVQVKSDWGSGYCADVTVTNNKSETVMWKVKFTIEGRISSAWNAQWSQNASEVSAQGESGRGDLGPGASLQWGFCANR